MIRFAGAALLLPLALARGADAPPPRFDTPAALEAFLFPGHDEEIFASMQVVFHLEKAGTLVTAAARVGPAYAAKVAANIESPEFRRQYATLGRYLELFGPCQRQQYPDTEGRWSSYKVYPGENHCREATKLVLANTLWSQVHYCRQLATGEAKAKLGEAPAHGPPYRLDEPPVKTHWLNAELLYALTDAAIALRLQETLRRRAGSSAVSSEANDAVLAAAGELEKQFVNRELAALALAKMMIRNYEAVHLRHLSKLRGEAQ